MGTENGGKKNLHAGHRERVKRNVCEHGFSQLEEHKLLELLLFYAIPQKDTNEIAHNLLDEFGSLDGVLSAEISQLNRVRGIGESTAVMIAAMGELHRRASKRVIKQRVFKTRDSIKELALSALENESKEKVVLFCFDSDYRLKRQVVLCEGTEFSVTIESKKVVTNIVESNATFIVLAHNHPRGKVEPSASDIDATRVLSVTLRGIGYAIADHLIVGKENDVYSMYSDPRFKGLFY